MRRHKMTKAVIKRTEDSNLLQNILKQKFFVDNPCNGKGVCGKCKVRILSGEVSSLTKTELELLKVDEIENGIRLSCLAEMISEEVEIEVLQKERRHRVLTEGFVPDFKREFRENGLGVAIDIGTTTVVAVLIDLHTGNELANASMINAQKHFGLDVLTRITYEYENPETGIEKLQEAIVDSLNTMLEDICSKAQKSKEEIHEIHVAANCTMMHMLLGVDAKPIGRAPYKPVFLEAKQLKAKEIGLRCSEETILYCLPQVSAYIGADIVAGAYVCELHKAEGNVMFIDIGTNGEIVLASKGRLLTCSCAAGPALEGMNISSGMRAAEGAIEDIKITESGIELKTIGDVRAEGICGSGILAAVKELLRTGIVTKSGAFIKLNKLSKEDYRLPMIRQNGVNREFVIRSEDEILVTQNDVRQVQLAKGAILSGFTALLQKAGIKMQDLDKVLIAGQFGAHLPAESLTGTGILPACVKDKIEYVGNTSKTGAYMTLMSQKAKEDIEQLADKMEYMELAETENYEMIFVESMTFSGI